MHQKHVRALLRSKIDRRLACRYRCRYFADFRPALDLQTVGRIVFEHADLQHLIAPRQNIIAFRHIIPFNT